MEGENSEARLSAGAFRSCLFSGIPTCVPWRLSCSAVTVNSHPPDRRLHVKEVCDSLDVIVQNVLLHLPVLKHMCLHFFNEDTGGGQCGLKKHRIHGFFWFVIIKRMFLICLCSDLGIRIHLRACSL